MIFQKDQLFLTVAFRQGKPITMLDKFLFLFYKLFTQLYKPWHINDMETEKIPNNTAPTRTKHYQYSLSTRLKVNQKKNENE